MGTDTTMLRILSWGSALGCEKLHANDFDMYVHEKQALPVASLPMPCYLKRKRSLVDAAQANTSSDDNNKHSTNCDKQRTAATTNLQLKSLEPNSDLLDFSESKPQLASIPNMDSTTATLKDTPEVDSARANARQEAIRQTISSQISLEILLKHKEMRLIDQEMAKCQIALEQLRRCSEIPYPGLQHTSEYVTTGRGPGLRRHDDRLPAESPASWGVVDGPYSRHYAKWLLPDARFDGGEHDLVTVRPAGKTPVGTRSSRGSFVDLAHKSGSSVRTQRSGKLKALPPGYGQPKEKATGPMIVKRKSDGAMVKLVCPDCGRHDFGSAQGFINHCRIGHQRSFASHDAAAEACGELAELDDQGIIKAPEPVSTPSGTNVHPLIRSARLLSTTTPVTPSLRGGHIPKSDRIHQEIADVIPSPNFQASSQTPHLSALIKGRGMDLNLQDLVSAAKTKVELPESDSECDEMDLDLPTENRNRRHPQVAGSKQPIKSASSPLHSPILNSRMRMTSGKVHSPEQQATISSSFEESRRGSFQALLPSPTNESNQAPSLIDDDEELDPQSPLSSDEVDDADIEFQIQDDEHGHPTTELNDADLPRAPATCVPPPTTRPNGHVRRPSAFRRGVPVRDDRHVTFVSPNPDIDDVDTTNDRKRRKVTGK